MHKQTFQFPAKRVITARKAHGTMFLAQLENTAVQDPHPHSLAPEVNFAKRMTLLAYKTLTSPWNLEKKGQNKAPALISIASQLPVLFLYELSIDN